MTKKTDKKQTRAKQNTTKAEAQKQEEHEQEKIANPNNPGTREKLDRKQALAQTTKINKEKRRIPCSMTTDSKKMKQTWFLFKKRSTNVNRNNVFDKELFANAEKQNEILVISIVSSSSALRGEGEEEEEEEEGRRKEEEETKYEKEEEE